MAIVDYNEQVIIMKECEDYFRQHAPNPLTRAQHKSTGNLAFNATKFNYLGDNVWEIIVDESIAPYMPYTNEPWTSPKWNGKKNPNEGWFDRMAADIAEIVRRNLGGRLEEKK